MKRIIFILSILLCCLQSQAQISFAGEPVPFGGGTFPIGRDEYVRGMYRNVHDTVERDNITPERRRYGMLVFDSVTNITWRFIGINGDLTNGTSNTNWTVFAVGPGKGKKGGITVWTDTVGQGFVNLYDSTAWFYVGDSMYVSSKIKIKYLPNSTTPGDSALVWAKDSTIKKTAPYAHKIKVSYPTPAYSSTSITGDTLTITTPTTLSGYGITDGVHFSDTSGMLSKYLRGVYMTVPGTLYNTPTYGLGNYVDTVKLSLATQSAYNVLSTGSSSGTPTFQQPTHSWLSDYSTAFVNSWKGRSGSVTPYQVDITDTLVTLTDGSTVTFDLSKSRQATVTLTGNGHILAFSNLPTGSGVVIARLRIVQDGTGGHDFTAPTGSYISNGAVAPSLNLTAGGITDWVITYEAATSSYYIKSCTF